MLSVNDLSMQFGTSVLFSKVDLQFTAGNCYGIIGPIANDTLFDTLGILTSGYLSAEEAMSLLMIGPQYEQVVIKTDLAAEHLTWLSSRILPEEEIARSRETTGREEEAYQREFGETMEIILGGEEHA